MKRSEMLKLIAKELDITNFRSWEVYGNTDDLAESVLSKIEESGMEPPPILDKSGCPIYQISYWEPEDET